MRLWQKRILVFAGFAIAFLGASILITYVVKGEEMIDTTTIIWPLLWALFIVAAVPWQTSVILIIDSGKQDEAVKLLERHGFRFSERIGGKRVYFRHMGPVAWWVASLRREHDYVEFSVPRYFLRHFDMLTN